MKQRDILNHIVPRIPRNRSLLKARKRFGFLAAAYIAFICFTQSFYQAKGADYCTNLADIRASTLILNHVGPGFHKVIPIGDLGPIETVVDMRGFVPMAFQSKQYYWSLNPPDSTGMRWYKVPTSTALLMLYFGDIDSDHIAKDPSLLVLQRFGSTKFLKESEAKEDMQSWCKVAYKITADSDALFKKLAGGDFDSAEPLAVFFTDQSAFVLINFRYKNLIVSDKGQLLIAVEFSRSLKGCKSVYRLYDTLVLPPSSIKDLKAAGDFGATMTAIAASIFGG